jgi:hypothetical protein
MQNDQGTTQGHASSQQARKQPRKILQRPGADLLGAKIELERTQISRQAQAIRRSGSGFFGHAQEPHSAGFDLPKDVLATRCLEVALGNDAIRLQRFVCKLWHGSA